MKRLQLRHMINNHHGLTLVEVMMTLLIFGVVMGVIGNVFFSSQGLYGRTTQRAGQQSSVRAGLGIMIEELRRAGADPDGPEFGPAVIALAVADDDTVRVQTELNDTPGIQTVPEPSEDVMYFYDTSLGIVMRDSGAGPQPFIENVTGFLLQYFDENNQPLGPLPLTPQLADAVRSVGIMVTTETPGGGEMIVNTRVGLRNTGG